MSSVSEQVAKANVEFSNKLFQKLLEQSQPEQNIFFSPISVHTILSLIYQTAKNETKNALSTVLNVPEATITAEGYKYIMSQLNDVENITLNMANKIWVKDNNLILIKESFKLLASEKFYSEVEQINFNESELAANNINNWVEQKTNNKITNVIDSMTLIDSSMILINAVYFKGDWEKKFKKDFTTKKPFYITNENVIDNVDMMTKVDYFGFEDNKELDAKVLQLLYTNVDASMLIVLPNERDGIIKLQEKIVTKDLNEISKNLKDNKKKVNVQIPKFKIESMINLKEILTDMGLGIIFTENADFEDLLDNNEKLVRTKISKAIQKVFVDVNEEGTEAAAVFRFVKNRVCKVKTYQFIADHPFIIVIKYKNNILFCGKIADPKF